MRRVLSDDEEGEEESGWTLYFDEFFDGRYDKHQYNKEIRSCFSASVGSSLISDAASSSVPVKKASASHHHHHHHHDVHDPDYKRSILSSKRRKTKVADNDLEDTASSRVNSPKIYNLMNQLEGKPAEAKDATDISQEKAGSTSAQRDGRADNNINEEEEEESELKKKGLFFVPLSMLVKHI